MRVDGVELLLSIFFSLPLVTTWSLSVALLQQSVDAPEIGRSMTRLARDRHLPGCPAHSQCDHHIQRAARQLSMLSHAGYAVGILLLLTQLLCAPQAIPIPMPRGPTPPYIPTPRGPTPRMLPSLLHTNAPSHTHTHIHTTHTHAADPEEAPPLSHPIYDCAGSPSTSPASSTAFAAATRAAPSRSHGASSPPSTAATLSRAACAIAAIALSTSWHE